MIDLVYQILLTVINKENQGYISPTEFNLIAANVQNEIFRSYFEDENTDKNKENRGLTNQGYSNLAFNQRQRITQFSSTDTLTGSVSGSKTNFTLPSDLVYIEENGLISSDGNVVDEVEKGSIARVLNTSVAPTALYPVYESFGNIIAVYPNSITEVDIRYLRKPKNPNWTYSVVSGKEIYNPSNVSHQDFELSELELSNIVVRMLSYFGINLREVEVVQIAEELKNKRNINDNA